MAFNRFLFVSMAVATVLAATPSTADTLYGALASAYANNPELNASRAGTRIADEEVPQALGGYRPTISAYATLSHVWQKTNGAELTRQNEAVGITISQPIFRGFRTENGVKAAEAAVRASRESLRNSEQNVLYDAAVSYMDVIRDTALLDLRRSNVRFLDEQVRAARDRFQVGEGTRTDVAQAEAAVAAAQSQVSLAEANLQASIGVYQQVVGQKPNALKPGKGVDKLLPRSLDSAIAASRAKHPAILAALHNADTAQFNVKIVEGELLPTVSIDGTFERSNEGFNGGAQGRPDDQFSVVARLSVPIYEGGVTYSRVRQAKEELGQRKIQVDIARDQVQAALIAAWGSLEAARAQTVAARSQVSASQLALEGVIEEQRVGQRTTLDVLDAQNVVINARVSQVQAERDAVVASFAVLAAVGDLSASRLGLQVAAYKPEHHYKQVRDKWIGLRTPDGR